MDKFKVEPDHLDAYAKQVGRAEDDMAAAGRYVQNNTGIETSGAGSTLWQHVVALHKECSVHAQQAFVGYKDVLAQSSAELVRSATYYRMTDANEAAAVDRTYPTGKNGPLGPNEFAAIGVVFPTFTDPEDAQECLKADPEPGFFEARWKGLVGDRWDAVMNNSDSALSTIGESVGVVLDLCSPTALINEGIKLIFNYDVLGSLAQLVAGDWDTFDSCAKAWIKLGVLCSAVGTNVDHGNRNLSVSWNGQAADTAYDYFNEISRKIKEAQEIFKKLHGCYEEVAREINAFINVLKAAMTTIGDIAIQVALEAAAGAAAAATGVGLVLTVGAAAIIAAQCARAAKIVDDTLDALNMLYITINGARSSGQAGVVAEVEAIKKFPVPKREYDNQVV
ncbi:hypothetical protein [Streptomyces alkaliterrae]|uniref:WXG100 family type VII secretion target n=1 Tax=Streptomyces alkaliterrae TaxID=2213162 RepID=A0A5P0YX37_9ACTN|nr:hypothetical protein [Streptomyces alkaliterrae]MBB1261239.1 hypothetical protein [Streptomyces alkaliterrae]MQS04846.1 hypothetical protein [Streptomyces alkaliterrae]